MNHNTIPIILSFCDPKTLLNAAPISKAVAKYVNKRKNDDPLWFIDQFRAEMLEKARHIFYDYVSFYYGEYTDVSVLQFMIDLINNYDVQEMPAIEDQALLNYLHLVNRYMWQYMQSGDHLVEETMQSDNIYYHKNETNPAYLVYSCIVFLGETENTIKHGFRYICPDFVPGENDVYAPVNRFYYRNILGADDYPDDTQLKTILKKHKREN